MTDATNAAITGVLRGDGSGWSAAPLESLRIPASMMPTVVDTSGIIGAATALPGAPPIAALVGDQQASLLGQACVRPGPAKITFGTGGMLDMVLGPERPKFETRGEGGTFPIITWRLGGVNTWGLEAIMLAAGTNVEWLRDDLGILTSSDESHDVAQQCADSGGVVFVPALLGLGTPQWDFGARGTVLGLTRGTGRPELVRAVLEGVAQRGADLVEAADTDGAPAIEVLRIDGGMSRNPTFVQALADASRKPVEVSPVKEATTLGAGFLAGLAVGTWPDLDALVGTWKPSRALRAPGRPGPRSVAGRGRAGEPLDPRAFHGGLLAPDGAPARAHGARGRGRGRRVDGLRVGRLVRFDRRNGGGSVRGRRRGTRSGAGPTCSSCSGTAGR